MPKSLPRALLIPFVASFALLLLWLGLAHTLWAAPPLWAQELAQNARQPAAHAPTLSIRQPTPQVDLRGVTKLATKSTLNASELNASEVVTPATLLLTTTVGTNSSICATADRITVAAGSRVYYCYAIRNASDYTLTLHSITAGEYRFGLTSTLPPSAEGFLTVTAVVDRTTPNTNTWTATATTGIALYAVDTTTVLVPAISLSVTVGSDPHRCAEAPTIDASVGTELTYCYRVWNRGEVPLAFHRIRDSHSDLLGASLPLTAALLAGESTFMTVTTAVTQSATNVVTWTAFLTDTIATTATNRAQVRVPTILLSTTVAPGNVSCTNPAVERWQVYTVTVGSLVTFCYWATNTGGVPLVHHVVGDKIVQRPSTAFTLTVNAEESVVVSATTHLTQTLVNQVNWLSTDDHGLWATASQTVTVYVIPATSVQVFTFYDVNHNRQHDEGELGLPNVEIGLEPLLNKTNKTMSKLTDGQGRAHFSDLTPGTYTAEVKPVVEYNNAPYTLTVGSVKLSVIVNRGEETPVPFGYTAGAQNDWDTDGVWDSVEGLADRNGDGKPDYADGLLGGLRLFLPMLAR